MASILPNNDENRNVNGQDDLDMHDDQPVWSRREQSPTALSSMAVGVIATALVAVGVALLVVAFGYAFELLPRFAIAGLGTWALASAIALVVSANDEVGGPHHPGYHGRDPLAV